MQIILHISVNFILWKLHHSANLGNIHFTHFHEFHLLCSPSEIHRGLGETNRQHDLIVFNIKIHNYRVEWKRKSISEGEKFS